MDHLPKRDTVLKMSDLQRCLGKFVDNWWKCKFRQRDPRTKNVRTRIDYTRTRIPGNVLPKIIIKPTPSLLLYTDIVGLTESHTERYLSSSHPNRCLYSVLAFMGYAYSPMLCATNTHAVRVRPCTNDAKIFWKIIWNPKRKAELKSNWATLVI